MFGLVSVTQREAHDLAGQVRGSNRLAATLLWRLGMLRVERVSRIYRNLHKPDGAQSSCRAPPMTIGTQRSWAAIPISLPIGYAHGLGECAMDRATNSCHTRSKK